MFSYFLFEYSSNEFHPISFISFFLHLQTVVLLPEFEDLQETFCREQCAHFEDGETA
jgi:hypothetical protein